MEKKIGIIGIGNMGSAFINGLLSSKFCPSNNIIIFDKIRSKAESFEKKNLTFAKDEKDLVRNSDYIILAVKPNNVKDVCLEIKNDVSDDSIIISIAAGIEIDFIKMNLSNSTRIARVMPNTPALICKSVSAIAFSDNIDNNTKNDIMKILKTIGEIVEIDEKLMNAVTGLSGSGPAYVFTFIEALKDGGVKMGLSHKVALQLAVNTVIGAAEMVKSTDEHPDVLKDKVSSPGGTTVAALHVLDKYKFRAGIIEAVEAAVKRANELQDK